MEQERKNNDNKEYDKNNADHAYQGWILYTRPESIRNRHYIDLYHEACQKYGMSVTLGIYDQERPEVLCINGSESPVSPYADGREERLCELFCQQRPDFVVNRTRDYRLALALEASGVRVYNNSQVARLGNDKDMAYRYMQRRGIPVMPIVCGAEAEPDCYPVVVKSSAGHGGTEVFLICDAAEWKRWKQDSYQKDTKYVVQQAASDTGRDLRVYVVGGQIVASVLRTSRVDFRSNTGLGGEAVMYELNSEETRLVKEIISELDIGMAGVDFIFHHGRPVFNEIEDMVGARMLYALTDDNIVDTYVSYIRRDLEAGSR